MTSLSMPAGPTRNEAVRWGLCLAVVVAAHAGAVLALLYAPPSSDADFVAGAAVVMIDLPATPAATPTPPTELPPGPEEMQSEATPVLKEETKPPEPVAEVALPEPEPPKPEPPSEERQATAPPSTMAVPDEAPPTAGVETPQQPQPPSAAVQRWASGVSAQIARLKHYPPHAQARHEEGIVRVSFTVDRDGRVVESHVIESSGFTELDQEFLSEVARAQLPKPPAGAKDAELVISIGMKFSLK
jgi:periplasmic protein TonB